MTMLGRVGWPVSARELQRVQEQLRNARPTVWRPSGDPVVAAVFVAFARGLRGSGEAGDPAWAAAVAMRGRQTTAEREARSKRDPDGVLATATVAGAAAAGYRPGLLALRVGPITEACVSSLDTRPDVLLLNATGRDHPRRAGLAVHLGAVLDVPTVGLTDKPLVATGPHPGEDRGHAAPLRLDGEVVAYTLRVRQGSRPVVVHAGWRTDARTALDLVRSLPARARTPEPLRRARTIARSARRGSGS